MPAREAAASLPVTVMPKRTKSSAQWLAEHESDPYVKAARAAGYRSRAVYKLEEIQKTDRLLKPGIKVVDLGAAPGGWSQYCARLLQGKGRIVALDILPMDAITNVEFIQGDFGSDTVFEQLMAHLGTDKVDLVLSDIAPNMSGMSDVDHLRAMHLVELTLDFAERSLKPGGDYLVKVFQGRDFNPFIQRLRGLFETVKTRKPAASRSRSPELYVLARGFRMV
ncbi:MAG: 23S rRNA (uridine(2552)-2'-O)-methyltransferase RlmE [Steroidobacteraceae bacterium]